MDSISPAELDRLLALSREARLSGPESSRWAKRLTPLRPQLIDAVRELAASGRGEDACELAANVWRLWLVSGQLAEGRALLAPALAGTGSQPSSARALALYADGLFAFRLDATADSLASNKAALECARLVHDQEAESLALVGLSRLALRNGDYVRVRDLALQARRLASELEPEADVMPLHLLAVGYRLSGSYDDAARLYTESLGLNRSLGDAGMVATELHNLGHLELHRGNLERAEQYFNERETLRNMQDPYEDALTDLNQAALSFYRGEPARARELLGSARATLERAGMNLDPDDAFEVRWLEDRLG